MKMTAFFLLFTWSVGWIVPLRVHAETFDPSYILSDADLTNWNTMTVQDIQMFLASKNSALKEIFAVDIDGMQKSAAEIIYNAARTHRINPKVLLVLLQKEQSIITDASPRISQFDWATGFGLCDACDPDDPAVAKYKGFAKQIDSAAGSLRFYLDHYTEKTWIKRAGAQYTIDNVFVIPATAATAFLYTYTPHIEGNKNFWRVWREWFKGQLYPDGVLIKVVSDPRVWYVTGGTRRTVESESVLVSYFGDQSVITVDNADLDVLPQGAPLNFPNHTVIHTAEDERYYLHVDETIHPFASAAVLRAIGVNPLEIIEAKKTDIASYTRGTFITVKSAYPTGAILKGKKSGKLFYVQNGIKYPLLDSALLSTNFKSTKPAIISDVALADYTQGEPVLLKEGAVVGVKGEPEIYLVSSGGLRHIASEQIFFSLGYTWDDVVWISGQLAALHPVVEPINFGYTNATPSQLVAN